jgi:hypothetical protein
MGAPGHQHPGMTWSLVVGADGAGTAAERAALEACGHHVLACPGPVVADCPVLRGLGCPLVERADVLFYDRALARLPTTTATLLDALRSLYADRPIILTEADVVTESDGLDLWVDDGVWRLVGQPDIERVELLVEEALAERL